MTSEEQLSGQTIQNLVEEKALEVSKQVRTETLTVLEDDTLELPEIDQKVDVYDAETKFVMIMIDGIGVKKLQNERVSSRQARTFAKSDNESAGGRVNSHIVLFEKKTGDFEYITSAVDNSVEELIAFDDVVKSKVIKEYGNDEEPLKVVAISDGAKNIRNLLLAIFGVLIVIILDWYHYCSKVREFIRQDC